MLLHLSLSCLFDISRVALTARSLRQCCSYSPTQLYNGGDEHRRSTGDRQCCCCCNMLPGSSPAALHNEPCVGLHKPTSASAANMGTYFFSRSLFKASVKNLNCSVRTFCSTSYTTPLPNVGTLKLYTWQQRNGIAEKYGWELMQSIIWCKGATCDCYLVPTGTRC